MVMRVSLFGEVSMLHSVALAELEDALLRQASGGGAGGDTDVGAGGGGETRGAGGVGGVDLPTMGVSWMISSTLSSLSSGELSCCGRP